MWKYLIFLKLFFIVGSANAIFSGPYLLWGQEKLRNIKLPSLASIDESDLSTLYKEAKSVVLFVRNSSTRLDADNFPNFKALIDKNSWVYLPQNNLPAEPLDYNANVEVVTLVGPPSQQDVEITALYKDALTIYGEGEVLGILASRDDEGHYIYKREAEEATTTSLPATDEPTETNFIYRAPGKAILYTTSPPILNINLNGKREKIPLLEHDKEITFDDRSEWSRLNIGFKVNNTRLRLRFNFTLSVEQYWQLTTVEVEYKEYNNVLTLGRGLEAIAPKGFSFRCASQPLVFKSDDENLTISDFQVQPWLEKGSNRFSDAYDCVGFMTVPIWCGIFVTTVLLGVMFLGITALMEIKPPNRFESSRSKQLTFTVQE